MQSKFISYVASIIDNTILFINFFESLDDAYKELGQAAEELDLLKKEGIPTDVITVTREPGSITITSSKPEPLTIRFVAGFGPIQ